MGARRGMGADFLAEVRAWRPGVCMFVTHYATTRPRRFPRTADFIQPVAAGTPQSAARMLRLATRLLRRAGSPMTTPSSSCCARPSPIRPGRRTASTR